MFDPKKPVQTRDGRKARVLCNDLNFPSGKTIAAAVEGTGTYCGKPTEGVNIFHSDGHYLDGRADNSMDLVNVPDQVVRYVNVYTARYVCGGIFVDLSQRHVYGGKDPSKYTTVKLTFENGKLISSEVVR